MKDEIKKVLYRYDKHNNGDKDWWSEPESEQYYEEVLREGGKWLSEQDRSSRRWWTDKVVVKEFDTGDNNFIIGYADAEATGDRALWELGYEFDSDTAELYEAYEVTVTKYRPQNDES